MDVWHHHCICYPQELRFTGLYLILRDNMLCLENMILLTLMVLCRVRLLFQKQIVPSLLMLSMFPSFPSEPSCPFPLLPPTPAAVHPRFTLGSMVIRLTVSLWGLDSRIERWMDESMRKWMINCWMDFNYGKWYLSSFFNG